MKRFTTALIWLALSIGLLNAQNIYVLSTGVSNYQNQDINLRQTTKDAKAFKAVMDKQTKNVSILTSKNASHDNIMDKLRTICNRATSQDMVVFYFSGHGFSGGIVPYDKPLFYRELIQLFSASAAKLKVVYIDACHAGSVVQQKEDGSYELAKDVAKGNNTVFITACRSDEISAENSWAGNGFFTQSLLKGLRGKADANNDKEVTVMELFTYVYKDVLHSTQNNVHPQHPQLIGPKSCHEMVLMKW